MKIKERASQMLGEAKRDQLATRIVKTKHVGESNGVVTGTFISGVSVLKGASSAQLNFGVVTKRRFVYGIVDATRSKFYPGRILSDKTGALSFIPGLDLEDRFIPGVVRGSVFVPGIYYTGAFIPGIYRNDEFVPGRIGPKGLEKIPDSSDVGMMLRYGNPFNWDLSEAYTPTEEEPDLLRPEHEKIPKDVPAWERERTKLETLREDITCYYQIPIGHGNGSKPPSGKGWEGPKLPGHSESIARERERSNYEALDFDKDGKPNFGWRILDPTMQPEPGKEGTISFYFDDNEEDDFEVIGEAVGIGMGSAGGGFRLPRLTGNPVEDAKRILGGLNPNKRNRIQLGCPGPGGVNPVSLGAYIVLGIAISAVIIIAIHGIDGGCENSQPHGIEPAGGFDPDDPNPYPND